MSLKEDVLRYRNRGVPLLTLVTADEYMLEASLVEWYEDYTPKPGMPPKPALIGWDCVEGPTALNKEAKVALKKMAGDLDPESLLNPVELLIAAKNLPEGSVLVMRGAHKILENWPACQAINNLRDHFKTDFRQLYLLGPDFRLPPELAKNVAELEELLPDEDSRSNIITTMCSENEQKVPKDLPKIVRATHGLPPFTIEQSAALSIVKGNIDLKTLWRRWRQAVNAVKGLKVLNSSFTFNDIGGLAGFKQFAKLLMNGLEPPDCILFIDELEKALAGAGGGGFGDSSGVSQDILGTFLSWMEENNATGLISVGPPGAGKSLGAQALGSVGDIPTIAFDVGGLKGSYVGESEQNARDAMRTIKSVAKRTFWIATCNSLAGLPPELKRRFRYGIWYFDLPNEEERAAIWKIHLKRTGITSGSIPDDDGWTGAEIRTCCDLAKQLDIPPEEAATWISPVSASMKDTIEKLRNQAEGSRWLSASAPGVFSREMKTTKATRKFAGKGA